MTHTSMDSGTDALLESTSILRNELPLPTELLYEIVGHVLSSYLHREMLGDSQPGCNDVSALTATSLIFRALTVDILRSVLEIPHAEDIHVIISVRKKITRRQNLARGSLKHYSVTLLQSLETGSWTFNHEFAFPEPRSTYFDCYHLYCIGVEAGMFNLATFNPVDAGLRTWAVDEHQLCRGVPILTCAFKLCKQISPHCMRRRLEAELLTELMRQLTVRQFQIWRWCLIRAFHLIPLLPADGRRDVDSAIMRLLQRMSRCEDLTPIGLGYPYVAFQPIPWEKVTHIPKVTRRNLEESHLLLTVQKLSSWEASEPDYAPPWRGEMHELACRWRDIGITE